MPVCLRWVRPSWNSKKDCILRRFIILAAQEPLILRALDLYNQRLGSRTYRIVNNNDIVCNLPFEGIGYSHVGQFKYITAEGKLHDDPSYWWLLLDGVWGRIESLSDLDIMDGLTDHLPQSYTEKLEMLSR